ncbi:MAG TPA: hypothetical protein VGR45_08925 [Stellaceae bacterium]|nr:hypothetical protein [Stellaceae bacterium]
MTTPVVKIDFRQHRKAFANDVGGGDALTDADFRGCRWIEGNPSPLRSGMFCGLPVVPGESWCAGHRDVVFGDNQTADGRADGLTGLPGPVPRQNRRVVGI